MGGREPQLVLPAFCQYGEAGAVGPVLISVPHAGREYSADLIARARVGLSGLQALEDRHADMLAADAIAAGHCTVIARRGRAILDLNRDESEIDVASVADMPPGAPTRTSAKLRGGLGLVPHRYHSIGDLWLRRPSYQEVASRIRDIHAPYHAQIHALMTATRAAHGTAILIDLHSMPPIRGHGAQRSVDVVIGDRFGQSASADVTRLAAEIVAGWGMKVAINMPYAGGYTLDRHGQPKRALHAIQVEMDRSLYLDAALMEPAQGLSRCREMIADLACRLAAAFGEPQQLAAE